ncbi:hypothetical protein DLM45_12565 [Hyphomicrobium methylovorum]|nr:tetratricopeptide repeat protein [Hyphomicrobium methylovorum]MBA2127047.1 hypothetical protein [Hyphomicrobium methylovorum]
MSMLPCAAIALISTMVGAIPLAAETSSWITRKSAPEPEKPLVTKPAAAKQSHAGTSEIEKNIPSTAPATGDDAAYMAFDQGQYLTALKLAEEAAARGEPQANTLIGRIYTEGLGIKKDPVKAYSYFSKAAELGDVQGTFAIALALAQGYGVKKDRRMAAVMFEKAALTGHAEANYNLGVLFLKGDGKPENPIRAFQHIRFAAEKGLPQAQYDVAELYQTGTGTDPNALESARWLSRAAEQGLPVAQYDYAVKLLQGFGLTKDEPKIPVLMKAAAEKGIPGAQNRMAYICFEGIKMEKNPVEGAKWRLIAKRHGVIDQTMDDMIAKLSKADRKKAEAAAAAWSDHIQAEPEMSALP